jgi:hypothetical protein
MISAQKKEQFHNLSIVGAHRGRVCIRVFLGVSVHVCCGRVRYTI